MNSEKKDNMYAEALPFEAAMDKVGFGLYAYFLVILTGFAIISFACIAYASMFIVPTSACELKTTSGQQGMLAAGPVIGLLLGAMVWGYLADTRGRRRMLLVSLSGATILNAIATISVNWIMLLILQFFAALFASGIYTMSMSLLSESVPMAKRNFVVLVVSSIFLLAQGIMAILALPIIPLSFSNHLPSLGIYWNSWRLLMLIYCVPSIISGIWFFLMHESPKFVYAKGDEERALKILKSIYRFGKSRSKGELQVKGLLKADSAAAVGPLAAKDQIVPLFKSPLLKYTVIMSILFICQQVTSFVVWLPTIANQFMRILQAGESSHLTVCGVLSMETTPQDPNATPCALNETSLLVVLGVGALNSIFNLFVSVMIGYVGRRNIAIFVIVLCGLSGILVNLVANVIGSAILFVIMTLATIAIGLYTAIAVPLFPTHLRAMAIALTMTGGRIGTFASIQILNLLLESNCEVGFYLFCSIFLASALAAYFLPDDRKLQALQPAPEKPQSNSEKPQIGLRVGNNKYVFSK